MAICSINSIENKTTVVNVGNSLTPLYYNVKTSQADEFQKEFNARNKKNKIIYNSALITSALSGVLLVNFFSKKMNTAVRFLMNMAGGISTALITAPFVVKHINKKLDEITNKYNAEINNEYQEP